MFAQRLASRRAAQTVLRPRLPTRRTYPMQRQRPISFLPWKRKPTPQAVPVYFAKPNTGGRGGAIRRQIVRFTFTTLVFYTCWQIFATVVFDPLLDWADREWEELSDKEKEELGALDEDEEPGLFLPFPFTTKEVKQPPYKGSDPEWLMFLSVNKDQQLQKDIKVGLAEVIRRGVEKNPAFVKLLGGRDIKVKKMWLDIIYPPSPPPKHYVSGILIEDDGIYWGDQPIDSQAASSLNVILYPKAVAMTAWTFVNFLVKQTVQDVSKALGFGEAPPPEPTWQSVALNRMREQGGFGGGSPPPTPPTTKETIKVPAGQHEKPPTIPVAGGSSGILGIPLGGDSSLDPRVQAALQAAALTFSKTWKPAKQHPNRGCIRVDGLVELSGKSAVMAVYVLGWYDPKLRKFMGIQTGLKHLIQLKQRPAGGS